MLVLGSDKTDTILEQLPESYLLIDDGTVIDALTFPTKRRQRSKLPKITVLDLSTHAFNPLDGMNYRRAEDFVSLINDAFPGGKDTLTKQGSAIALMDILLSQKATSLKDLTLTSKKSWRPTSSPRSSCLRLRD
jgi:hypothetical protein